MSQVIGFSGRDFGNTNGDQLVAALALSGITSTVNNVKEGAFLSLKLK